MRAQGRFSDAAPSSLLLLLFDAPHLLLVAIHPFFSFTEACFIFTHFFCFSPICFLCQSCSSCTSPLLTCISCRRGAKLLHTDISSAHWHSFFLQRHWADCFLNCHFSPCWRKENNLKDVLRNGQELNQAFTTIYVIYHWIQRGYKWLQVESPPPCGTVSALWPEAHSYNQCDFHKSVVATAITSWMVFRVLWFSVSQTTTFCSR